MAEPVIVTDIRCHIGENPTWHPQEKKLYWLDIPIGTIYRYDPKNTMVEKIVESSSVIGGFTIQEDNSLLLFMEKGTVKIWRNNLFIDVIKEIPILKSTRFNDVIVDPAGRVFCGTMPDQNGVAYLFLLNVNGDIRLILDNVGLSNGMGFTPDKKQMYFTDSKKGEIRIFDYDKKSGSLSNERTFLKIKEQDIEPDGLTVDSEGYIWGAQWNGACVKRYSPHGKEVMKIDLPTKKITSLTFAGDNYQEIYITSAIG
ncbi:MAG TPA: SMP-30/gluconolactonase/LRE family protein, partial [Atribacterota bacterium]|nr:SMP-30/gluconolactonase/LRE family protein [Atribacterota bacterium]